MKTYLSRTEKVIAALVVVVILAFFGLLKNINKTKNLSQIDTVEAINYKMARPEASYSDYSLDGREEDRVIDAVKKKAIQQKIELEKKTVAEKKAAEDKKKNEKAAVEKKQQAAKQVAKLQEVKKALASKLVAKRNAQVQESAKSNGNDYNYNSSGANVSQNNTPPAATEPTKTEEKKSLAEWKSLIQSKGAEAMAQFITAFRKGEVNGTDYNTMVTELLASEDSKQKALGLMGLKANNSAQSLKQLLTLDSSKFSGFESYIQTSIKSYLLPQNLGYLNQVLRSQDKVAVVKALDLLVASLDNVDDGDISVLADRGGRNVDTGVNLKVSSYQVLLPALDALSNSDDANIASLATSVANKIDSDASALAQN